MSRLSKRQSFFLRRRKNLVMAIKRRKSMDWSFLALLIKIAVMLITIAVGLWCGWTDSYGSFYIAVLVQAINNAYDAVPFLIGYTKFVTVFQAIAFLGAVVSLIVSIIHFTENGTVVDSVEFVIGITIALSIPLVHFGIECYSMIRDDRF